eukprot:205328-Prorocentrum_minimum.AAC.2
MAAGGLGLLTTQYPARACACACVRGCMCAARVGLWEEGQPSRDPAKRNAHLRGVCPAVNDVAARRPHGSRTILSAPKGIQEGHLSRRREATVVLLFSPHGREQVLNGPLARRNDWLGQGIFCGYADVIGRGEEFSDGRCCLGGHGGSCRHADGACGLWILGTSKPKAALVNRSCDYILLPLPCGSSEAPPDASAPAHGGGSGGGHQKPLRMHPHPPIKGDQEGAIRSPSGCIPTRPWRPIPTP